MTTWCWSRVRVKISYQQVTGLEQAKLWKMTQQTQVNTNIGTCNVTHKHSKLYAKLITFWYMNVSNLNAFSEKDVFSGHKTWASSAFKILTTTLRWNLVYEQLLKKKVEFDNKPLWSVLRSVVRSVRCCAVLNIWTSWSILLLLSL